jgi:hypothetical protein
MFIASAPASDAASAWPFATRASFFAVNRLEQAGGPARASRSRTKAAIAAAIRVRLILVPQAI